MRAPPISVSGECPDTNLCPTGLVISGFLPQNLKNPVRLVTISCPGSLLGGALRVMVVSTCFIQETRRS